MTDELTPAALRACAEARPSTEKGGEDALTRSETLEIPERLLTASQARVVSALVPLQRLCELAAAAAETQHDWYFDAAENIDGIPPNGHSQPWETCQHRDCALAHRCDLMEWPTADAPPRAEALAPHPETGCDNCEALKLHLAAAQESINGCAKKVAELAERLRAAALERGPSHKTPELNQEMIAAILESWLQYNSQSKCVALQGYEPIVWRTQIEAEIEKLRAAELARSAPAETVEKATAKD